MNLIPIKDVRVLIANKKAGCRFPRLVGIKQAKEELGNIQQGQLPIFPKLIHSKGKTSYVLRTVDGFAAYSIDATVSKVKEEEVGLANRKNFGKEKQENIAQPVMSKKHKEKSSVTEAVKRLKKLRKRLLSKKRELAEKVQSRAKRTKFHNREEYIDALVKRTLPIFPVGTKLPTGCWAMGDPAKSPVLEQQQPIWEKPNAEEIYRRWSGDSVADAFVKKRKAEVSLAKVLEPTAIAPVKKSKQSWDKPQPTESELLNATITKSVSHGQEAAAEQYIKRGRWGSCVKFQGDHISPIDQMLWSKAQVPHEKAPHQRALGGLRHMGQTMKKLPVVKQAGTAVFVALRKLFTEQPLYVPEVLQQIGKKDVFGAPPHIAEAVRKCMEHALKPMARDHKAPHKKEETPVNVELLSLWCAASKDPDDQPIQWLVEGAPAGLLHPIADRGIFPTYSSAEDAIEGDPEELSTPAENAVNYAGVDEDVEVAAEMSRMLKNRYVKKFKSLKCVAKYLGKKAIVSKIGVIKKIKNGKTKSRLVVDTKQSKITASTRKFERTLLPRSIDVAHDALDIKAAALKLGLDPSQMDFLIADFKDAFFILPNRPDERRWFVVQFRGEYYVFLRTTQGSRGAPLTWARFAALIARMTQSVTDVQLSRINTYVDDPILIAHGTKPERDMLYAIVLSMWTALGLPLSLEKAVRGENVTWTSAIFSMGPQHIIVEVKQAIVDDAKELVAKALAKNIFAVKCLRSLTGKLTHIASLVMTLRPFLSELYAAQYAERGTAPVGCVWTKQIIASLEWVRAFLAEIPGKLQRRYDLKNYLSSSLQVSLELDASPWGLGGVLLINGRPTSWFASAISTEELLILDIKLGDSAAQQTVEALAALVAMRAWHGWWSPTRSTVRVRSDSVSALILALKLKTSGRAPGIIAREMALDMAAALYVPNIAEHVPGIHNVVPDALSRKFQPGQSFVLPNVLKEVPELILPPRGREYYRGTKAPPPFTTSSRKDRAA